MKWNRSNCSTEFLGRGQPHNVPEDCRGKCLGLLVSTKPPAVDSRVNNSFSYWEVIWLMSKSCLAIVGKVSI